MKRIPLLISALTIISSGLLAQNSQKPTSSTTDYNIGTENLKVSDVTFIDHRCGTADAERALRDQDPVAFDLMKAQKEQQLQNWIANNYDANAKKAVIVVPVVVQIWESTSSVPDSRVAQQLQRLNEDFGRSNSDASNTPSAFSGVDCEIQFCLATKDPNGNSTTGIVRKTANGSPASYTADLWNTNNYLNIYVYDIGGSTLGFTFTAATAPNNAVHISTPYFGNTGGQFGMGRTATHEVGHWFNLEHIWGGGNGCGSDYCSDTPRQSGDNYGCPNYPSTSSCGGSSNAPNGDMFMNYMDYVNDNCMNAFTANQKTRMIAAINNNRPSLLNSSASKCVYTTGAEEITNNLAQVSVYPNPSVGTINIDLVEKVNSTISVFNVLGEEVYNESNNSHLVTVDLNNNPNGVYFVTIKSEGNVITKKVFLTK